MAAALPLTFLLIFSSCAFTVNAKKQTVEHEADGYTEYMPYIRGAAVGMFQNAANYAIKIGGRACNIVSVHDKNSISSLGNPRWFARVDKPHGKVPYHHINVNPKITGVPDPHIPISESTAKIAGKLGKGLDAINKLAPYAMKALFLYDAYEVLYDYSNGKTQEVTEKLVTKAATYAGASYGASAGAAIGTCVFPVVGSMIGGIIGGAIGGGVGGSAGNAVNEIMKGDN